MGSVATNTHRLLLNAPRQTCERTANDGHGLVLQAWVLGKVALSLLIAIPALLAFLVFFAWAVMRAGGGPRRAQASSSSRAVSAIHPWNP
jgi:flagellar biogenesis protein FliO